MRQNLDDGIVRAGGELQVRRGKRDGADRLRVGLVHLMRHPRTVREGHGCGLRATGAGLWRCGERGGRKERGRGERREG